MSSICVKIILISNRAFLELRFFKMTVNVKIAFEKESLVKFCTSVSLVFWMVMLYVRSF